MTTLSHLAEAYEQAKAEETSAADLRRELAAQIQHMTGHTTESSKTYKDGDWKVVVKQPVNRTMDWAAWETVKNQIAPELWPIETKQVLDEKGVKWLMNNKPEIYATLAACLSAKPGTIQVTVTRIETKE